MDAVIIIEARGKIAAWSRISRAIGLDTRIVATGGHLNRFPDRLFPIGLRLETGGPVDPVRRPHAETAAKLLEDLEACPLACPVYLATDDDVEGDVIALDLAHLLAERAPARLPRLKRLRPGAIAPEAMRRAIAEARPVELKALEHLAIQGRARAVTDRWIGATFSREARLPVGRVRSAVVGSAFLWSRSPKHCRGLPETGEVTFQARASSGGRFFQACVALRGDATRPRNQALIALAERFKGQVVPGCVHPRQSLSAAVAPRFGDVKAFSTGEALVHASRHHGLPLAEAMKGLQRAYLAGLVSYPRTDAQGLGAESAARVVRLGASCGLQGLEIGELEGPLPGAHEGLHPIFGATVKDVELARQVALGDLTQLPSSEEGPTWVMARIVTRRAFEAARPVALESGDWRPDNGPAAGLISREEADLLDDLAWERETGPNLPWGRDLMTGVRTWPMASVLLEGMLIEAIGRPSTIAAHVETAMSSGDLEPGDPGELPRLTPQGVTTLSRTRKAIWNPATCRMIEVALENRDNHLAEDEALDLDERVRHRIVAWFLKLPGEIQDALLESIGEGGGSGAPKVARGGSAPSLAGLDELEDSPFAFSAELLSPSPDWA